VSYIEVADGLAEERGGVVWVSGSKQGGLRGQTSALVTQGRDSCR
jgi:hypothetical protein